MSTAPSHINRPSDATLAAKAKRATAAAEKRAQSYAKTMLPGLHAERQREFAARAHRAKVPISQMPMCNATMPGTYRTGDGEVLQQPRPGSLHAFTLPSHGDRT